MTQLKEDNLDEPVARYVRRDYTALRSGQTVGQTLEALRSGPVAEKIVYFYVIDADEKLVGVVPTRRLLMSQPGMRLDDIMVANVISIADSMTVLDACEFFVMHRLLAFPVVDRAGKLLGTVDVGLFTDEMFGVSEKQSADDVFQLIGVQIERGRRGSPIAGFRFRFPWLLCNIAGGIGCALIASRYEHIMDSGLMLKLTLFIPVVLTLAEGVSMQSMTITLQGFRTGKIDWWMLLRAMRLELATAVLIGGASGLVVGLVAYLWKRSAVAAMAIGGSIWMAIVTACLLGVLLPTLVRLFKGDPKIAAGPVVLACADLATLLFYFKLSGMILQQTVPA